MAAEGEPVRSMNHPTAFSVLMTTDRAAALSGERGLFAVRLKANPTSFRFKQRACGIAFASSQYVGGCRPIAISAASVVSDGKRELKRRAYRKRSDHGNQFVNQRPVV